MNTDLINYSLNENDIPLLMNICSTYDNKIWEYQRLFSYSK
jgi:hypothetical protein